MSNFLNWIVAIVFMFIGIVNLFWGNDPFYGLFVIFSTLLFIPRTRTYIEKQIGFRIPKFLIILLGLFILWSALGVAELFDKVQLMLTDFNL